MDRLARLLMLSLVLTAPASAQEKYLISPGEEVIPILPGDDAASLIDWSGCPAEHARITPSCNEFGYSIDPWPFPGYFTARHKDVMGQWYVAKASGTIDTVYFDIGRIGDWLIDSTAYVRIHRSNIGPEYGPGIRPGSYDPPCQPWGYWINTNDIDRGITAFPEEATDTAWISTYGGSGGPASLPPIGEALVAPGGYPVNLKPDQVNFAAVEMLGPIPVAAGDRLFISIELSFNNVPRFPDDELPTQFLYCRQTVTTTDEYYPSRNWKFYEHEKGPANCAGLPADSLKHGWYARGSPAGDSLDVTLWNIWYAMTVVGNAPPVVVSQSPLRNTFSGEPRQVQAVTEDCYASNPGLAGISSSSIEYEVDGVRQPPVPMAYAGADTWEGNIPGQSPGSRVTYRVAAADLEGIVGIGPTGSYSVVPFGNAWYALDTGYGCTPHGIGATGTTVDESSFFLPPSAPVAASALDNGTSGPYDMGGYYHLFNDDFRYAWIGVNGGIALTKSPTDTQDVNSNGSWLDEGGIPWDFPGGQKHGRDAWSAGRMPGMFIAPMWADHLLGDTSGLFGRILYGDGGDTCLFIVQWDSMGAFDNSAPNPDLTTFRAILNRCTGLVEFQYEAVGTHGLDTAALVGMQADSNSVSGPEPGYVLLNRNGYPAEIRPVGGGCIRMAPTAGILAADGWNLFAISYSALDGDYSIGGLFPDFQDPVWRWLPGGGFTAADSLPPGAGAWLKSHGGGRMGYSPGEFISCLDVPVGNGWNVIGGPSCRVSTGGIAPSGGVISSAFFGYGSGGYSAAFDIRPGQAYWVKMSGAGTLTLCCSDPPAAPPHLADAGSSMQDVVEATANRITVSDASGRSQTLYLAPAADAHGRGIDAAAYELPPPPPVGVFDARFGSGRMLEVLDSGGESKEYVVSVSGAKYPVEVSWEIVHPPPPGRSLRVRWNTAAGDGRGHPLEGSGSMTVADPSVRTIVVSLGPDHAIPAGYSLGQAFPNPFNGSTAIRFSIPRAVRVTLTVYDLLGRAVRTLADDDREAGTHLTEWDGTGDDGSPMPTGVFIVKISAGDFSSSRKLLLLK